jgi:PPOX class probable F420-dependent enzyme|tara:strand:- start:162 stop:536 length:375 start_codon:yes stop_codon:yes gene_type:complete
MNINNFQDVEYINLVTYKNDGSTVTTPVWVAPHDDSLVITSSLNAGKVKRIRNNGKATIYATNQSGSQKLSESLDVKGSLITEPEEKAQAVDKIKNKYGLISKMFMRGPDENRAIIKLDEQGGE